MTTSSKTNKSRKDKKEIIDKKEPIKAVLGDIRRSLWKIQGLLEAILEKTQYRSDGAGGNPYPDELPEYKL